MKKSYVKKYNEFLKEDAGCGYATQGSSTGMGAVVSPGINTVPGVPGSAGSGDFGSPFLPTAALKNTIYKPKMTDRQGSKRYRGKEKAINQLKSLSKTRKTASSRVKDNEPSAVKSFSDFINDFK
jgi:hypothetical protein